MDRWYIITALFPAGSLLFHIIRLQWSCTVTEGLSDMLVRGNVLSWHSYSFWPVQRFPGIASSSREEALMQKIFFSLSHPAGNELCSSESLSRAVHEALNNSVPASELKHLWLSSESRVLSCGRLHSTRIPKPLLVLLYSPAGNISDGFMAPHPTSRPECWSLLCCWGNPALFVNISFGLCFFWLDDGNPSGTACYLTGTVFIFYNKESFLTILTKYSPNSYVLSLNVITDTSTDRTPVSLPSEHQGVAMFICCINRFWKLHGSRLFAATATNKWRKMHLMNTLQFSCQAYFKMFSLRPAK